MEATAAQNNEEEFQDAVDEFQDANDQPPVKVEF